MGSLQNGGLQRCSARTGLSAHGPGAAVHEEPTNRKFRAATETSQAATTAARTDDSIILIRCENDWPSEWLSVYGPVLQLQSSYPRKLTGIVSDEAEAPRFGLAGDQRVVGANWRSAPFQLGPDLARHTRVLPVKVEDGEIGE